MESHLLQMRGLKHHDITSNTTKIRGLKLGGGLGLANSMVASFTDAWIETITTIRTAITSYSRIFYRCVD